MEQPHMVPMILQPGPIAPEFDSAALVAAIRGAQADTVRYPGVRKPGLPPRASSATLAFLTAASE